MTHGNARTVNRVDFWRVVFTLLIMIFHFDDTYHLFPQVTGWYIAVEFFFLVSGYLLYERFLKKGGEESALRYTAHRLAGIYPAYVIMFVLYYLILIPVMRPTFEDLAYHVLDSVPELLLMQAFGLGRGWNYVNNTTWYISVMLVAGYFIWAMLRYRKELFLKVIGPFMVISGYAYLYRHNGSLDAVIPVEDFFRNYMLIRGFSGMLLGVYLHILREKCGDALNPRACRALSVLGSGSFLLVIVLATQCRYTVVDYTYLLMIAFGVFTVSLTLPASAEDGRVLPAVSGVPAMSGVPVMSGSPNMSGTAPGSAAEQGLRTSPGILGAAAPVLAKLSGITLEMYLLHDMFRAVIFPHLLPQPETAGAKLILMLLYIPTVAASAFALRLAAARLGRAAARIASEGRLSPAHPASESRYKP